MVYVVIIMTASAIVGSAPAKLTWIAPLRMFLSEWSRQMQRVETAHNLDD